MPAAPPDAAAHDPLADREGSGAPEEDPLKVRPDGPRIAFDRWEGYELTIASNSWLSRPTPDTGSKCDGPDTVWTLCGTSGFRARDTDCRREIADGEARLALTTWGVSELARRLRASSPNRRVRLIAVTGYGTPDDRRRAAEVGCDAHIVKPVGRGIWFVFVTEYLIRGAPS